MKYKLEQICTTITDGSHYSPKAVENGYPMFSVKDMLEYGFDYSKCKKISGEDFEKMKKGGCVPQKNDILVAKDGSYLKQIFLCNETKDEAILSSIAIFRPNTEYVIPEYLCYLLKSPDVYNYISSNCVSGSALPRIVLKDFKQVTVNIPKLEQQEKVISVLKPLDDKIKLNISINNNLMKQVTAKFHDMFSKYDNDISVYSTLGTIAKFKYGTMPKKEKLGTGNYVAFSGYQIVGLYPEVMYSEPQLIIVARGVGGCGDIKYTPANCYLTNLAIAIITTCVEHDDYLYHYLRLHDTKVMNTGSAQPQITVSTLEKYEIPIPSDNELSEFSDFVKPFKELYRTNAAENKQLTALRDSLLQKLMSGELDVSEIDI
ncbi:MAG: restriction endonuclease subunit S [Acutalibacteraceae bacterium]